jgi:shikimate kinase
VLNPENMDDLERNGIVVCLTARAETIAERLQGDATRPLLAGEDRLEKIRELQRTRESCYQRCRCMIDTTGQSVPQVVQAILAQPCIAALRGS